MKKFYLLLCIALISILTISCEKEDKDVTPIFKTDQWIGHYVGTTNGNVSVEFLGQTEETDLAETAIEFDVEKGDNDNELKFIEEDGEVIVGTVNGNNISFSDITTTEIIDGTEISVTAKPKAVFNGTTCTLEMDMTGTAIIQGIPLPVTVSTISVAEKQ